jgi:hypothetical protein
MKKGITKILEQFCFLGLRLVCKMIILKKRKEKMGLPLKNEENSRE